jgi:toxin secretion/phage lysis holin
MNEQTAFMPVALSTGGVVEYLFGGWTTMLTLLWWMVIIDFFTGWAAAWINGELKSRSGYYGVFRKVTVFLLITIAHLIDGILGDEHYFRDAVVFFYLANELLSIIENVGRMGVPMPDILRNAVAIFQSRSVANRNGKGNTEMIEIENGTKDMKEEGLSQSEQSSKNKLQQKNTANHESTGGFLHTLVIDPENILEAKKSLANSINQDNQETIDPSKDP